MPRILAPSSSFRKGSNISLTSFHSRGSRGSAVGMSTHSLKSFSGHRRYVEPREKRNQDWDVLAPRTNPTKAQINSHMLQFQPPSSRCGKPSLVLSEASVGSSVTQSLTPTSSDSGSIFQDNRTAVPEQFHHARRKITPAPIKSFMPTVQSVCEEEAWGQFVDVANEEKNIIRRSRILSRRNHMTHRARSSPQGHIRNVSQTLASMSIAQKS